MCVVSNIGDRYHRQWEHYTIPQPGIYPWAPITAPVQPTTYPGTYPSDSWKQQITVTLPNDKVELEKLRAEAVKLKKLLRVAKAYDDATGQPDCESGEKTVVLKAVAEALDIDLSEIWG